MTKLILTRWTTGTALLALVVVGALACNNAKPLPAKIVNIPGKLTPAAGLTAADYQVWGSAAEAPITVSSDGSFAADSSGWHTSVVFASPMKDSRAKTSVGNENGLYMSPAAGDSFLVADGAGYAIGHVNGNASSNTFGYGNTSGGGVMAMDATTTVLAMLLMHPVLAHPSPDVSSEQLGWMADKLADGWPCVTSAAKAYDADLAAGADFSLDQAFESAFLTCLEDVGDIPEFMPPVPSDDEIAKVQQGLEKAPVEYVVRQSDVLVSRLRLKNRDENGITVTPGSRLGTALDYYYIVTRLNPSLTPDGMESPIFTNIDPYSPHTNAVTLASGFIPADSYWSYLDIVGNTIKKVSSLIPNLVHVNPSSSVTMPAGNFFEARFFSGGEDDKTNAFLFEAAAARSHNITMAAVEAISVIPGVNEMLGNEAGQKTLEAAVREAVVRAEALTGISVTGKDIYAAIYSVVKKAVDTYAQQMVVQSATTGFLGKAADWAFSGGKKMLKFVVSIPTKIAKGGAAANRAFRIAAPESTMEYYIIAVGALAVDAGTSACGPKCQKLAACCPNVPSVVKSDCEEWAGKCNENACQTWLTGNTVGLAYCD